MLDLVEHPGVEVGKQVDLVMKLESLNVYDRDDIRTVRNELKKEFGGGWIGRIVDVVEGELAYPVWRLIDTDISSTDTIVLSKLLANEAVAKNDDRSVKSNLLPKIVRFANEVSQSDKKQITENLVIAQDRLMQLAAEAEDGGVNYNWSLELIRSDIYGVVVARMIYGDTEVVDKLLPVDHMALSENLIDQLEALKQVPINKLRKSYYLTQPGIKYIDRYGHDLEGDLNSLGDVFNDESSENVSKITEETDIDSLDVWPPGLVSGQKLVEKVTNGEIKIGDLSEWQQRDLIQTNCRTGSANYLIDNLASFDPGLYAEMVNSMVVFGKADLVLEHIDDFVTGVGVYELSGIFVHHGQLPAIIEEGWFRELDKNRLLKSYVHPEFWAETLVHKELAGEVDKLELIKEAIGVGKIDVVIEWVREIPADKQRDLISYLAIEGHGITLRTVIENMNEIDETVAVWLIVRGRSSMVLRTIDHFSIVNPAGIIKVVVESCPHELFSGWHLYARKIGLNVDEFKDKLMAVGEWSIIVNNRDYFTNIDYVMVSEGLLKKNDFQTITSNWEVFKLVVDKKRIVELMLDAGQYPHVFWVLSTLEVLDTQFIYDHLLLSGKEAVLLDYVEYFSNQDLEEVFIRLIQKGKVADVLTHLRKLPIRTHRGLVREILKENLIGDLRGHLDVVSGLELGTILAIEGLNGDDYVAIFERLGEHHLGLADIEVLYNKYCEGGDPDSLIRRLFDQHYYRELETLVSSVPEGIYPKLVKLMDTDEYRSRVRQMVTEQNWGSVVALVNMSGRLGIRVSDIVGGCDLSQLGSDSALLLEDRESYRNVEINKEIAKFYLDEWLRIGIFGVVTNLRLGRFSENDRLGRDRLEGEAKQYNLEFSRLQDRLLLSQLEHDSMSRVERMIDLFREYLVFACTSEMRHQDQLRDSEHDVTINGKFRYKNNDPESMRLYFQRCEDRFRRPGWHEAYGGLSWAEIARCGVEVWAPTMDESRKIFLIDRVVDIQHNTGRIFDKDTSRVKFNDSELAAFLDFKKSVGGMEQLVTYCLAKNLITPSEAASYRRKMDQISELSDFDITPVRRELSE